MPAPAPAPLSPDHMNLSLLLALPPTPRDLILARAGLGGVTQHSPAEAATRLALCGEEARAQTLRGFGLLRQAPLRQPLLVDPLYGSLLRLVYGHRARLPLLSQEHRHQMRLMNQVELILLLMRSGMGGVGAHSQKEVAELVGWSPEKTQHVVTSAMRRLENEEVWERLFHSIDPDGDVSRPSASSQTQTRPQMAGSIVA